MPAIPPPGVSGSLWSPLEALSRTNHPSPISCSLYLLTYHTSRWFLDGPFFWSTLVFTVVSPSWTTVFFRCSGYLRNLCFVFSTPRGEVGTSTFRLPYKVSTQILPQPCFTMFSCFETHLFIDVLSTFATAFMCWTTLVVDSSHRPSHLLSVLLTCENQV